ncbi:MAG: amidohydrolase [Deltaproteobacteria bacterium]|nr:amidohydrolase [Deltaproteobacteria bacterium]MBI3078900.1 amidohydrolase [Deltaproteobacteria bacterium]
MRRRSVILPLAVVWALAVVWGLAIVPPAAAAVSPAELKQLAFEAIQRNADQIALIGDSLFYFAEPGMQEIESTKFLKEILEGIGFQVETGVAGMPTALWAKWGSGRPYIVIATEVDALPEGSQTPGVIPRKPLVPGAPGHMEGHNTMGAVAVGAAYAVKQAMERYRIPGTVAVSFGPAEEQLISRPYIVRAGYFKDVDAAVITHIGDVLGTGYGIQNYALIGARFTFHGKTAHGSVNPWDGKDAVDAVVLMDIGFDKLREHLRPTYRGHRTITMGGIQPNIIADKGQIWWFVRDASGPGAKAIYDKLVDIARGAALMTGTRVEIEPFGAAWPQMANQVIAEAIQKNIEAVGMPKWSEDEVRFAKELQKSVGAREVGLNTRVLPLRRGAQTTASNDIGDITWNVPTAPIRFPASAPGVQYHHWTAAITPATSIAHKGEVAGAKVLAASVLDLLTSPELLQKARAQFEADTKETKYFSLLPPDAKPPLDLNQEMMEKYRPEMRKFYLNKKVQFR